MRVLFSTFGLLITRGVGAQRSLPPRKFVPPFRKMSANIPADINATPVADQHLVHDGKEYTTIREGLAYILVPASSSKTPQQTPKGENQSQSVFYNPIQQFNRDLSVLTIKAYGEDVIERRRKRLLDSKMSLNAKKRDKKRKREEDGLSSEALRRAGKHDGSGVTRVGNDDAVTGEGRYPGIEGGVVVEEMAEKIGYLADSTTAPPALQQTTTTTDEAEALVAKQIQAEQKPAKQLAFSILDALSATGLRALRYAHEIHFTTSITANDLLPEASRMIQLNAKHNKLEHRISAVTGNALTHMYSKVGDDCKDEKGRPKWSKKYDVIDLDPYGTAAPFLDAAVQAVRDDGGLLCVTCTDAGVWASNGYPEKAFSLYGGTTIKGELSHEGGLRLILHAIATSAARYGMSIEPLLSLSIDYYARVFVRIHKSPLDVKFLSGKTMMVYNCDSGCGAWTTQMIGRNKLTTNKKGDPQWKHVYGQGPNAPENCKHCGMRTHVGGPMYGGPIQDPVFIKKILDSLHTADSDTYHTLQRIEGMLTVAMEEVLPSDPTIITPTSTSKTGKWDPAALDPAPLLFLPSNLAKVIHCVTPQENGFKGALRGLGYNVTRSHTKAGSIKTDAPWEVIWEVMREWARQKAPVKEGRIREGTAGFKIMGFDKIALSEEVNRNTNTEAASEGKKLKVVFDEKLGAEKDRGKLVRYQLNPRENWGPMARARGPPEVNEKCVSRKTVQDQPNS